MSHMPPMPSVVSPGTITLVWNARDFGARGDGLTDDTAALQRAINADENVDLILPGNATYVVSAPLKKSSGRLRIHGYGSTIKLKSTFPAQLDQTGVIDARTMDELTVENLTLDGNSTALNGGAGFPDWSNFIHMVMAYHVTLLQVRDCHIKNFPSQGIQGHTCGRMLVDGCLVEDGMKQHIFAAQCTNVVVHRNVIVGRGNVGTNTLIGGLGVLLQMCNYVDVSENHVSNTSDTGIKGEGCDYVNCEGNTVEDSGKDGIKWHGYDGNETPQLVRVHHNVVNRINAWRVDGSSLILVADYLGSYIGGNQVRSGGTRIADAIRVNLVLGAQQKRHIIEGNLGESIDGLGISGVSVDGITIRGNRFDAGIGINGAAGDVAIEGNTLTRSTIDTTNNAIAVLNVASGRVAVNNNIVSQHLGGIAVYALAGATVDAISINDNVISTCHQYGIRVDNSGASNANIRVLEASHNICRDTVAGASSVTCFRIGTANLTVAIARLTHNTIQNLTGNTLTNWLELTGSTADKIALLDVTGVEMTGVSDPWRFGGSADRATRIVGDCDSAPTQITANQNDYQPPGMTDTLMLTSSGAVDITGFATGTLGRRLWVYNIGANNITLKHQSGSSAAGNRIIGRGGADVVLTPNTGALLWYTKATTSRWVVLTDTL